MNAAISTTAKLTAADALLMRALEGLWASAQSDIASFSDVKAGCPVPGTIDPDFLEFIVDDLALIRDIESHIGFQRPPSGPTWFDDLIERRGAWEGSAL